MAEVSDLVRREWDLRLDQGSPNLPGRRLSPANQRLSGRLRSPARIVDPLPPEPAQPAQSAPERRASVLRTQAAIRRLDRSDESVPAYRRKILEPNEPMIEKWRQHAEELPIDFDANVHCRKEYREDPVTLETMDELYRTEPKNVGWLPDNRCFNLQSLIRWWESAFALYDPQSRRIVPQYPRDPRQRDVAMFPDDVKRLFDRAVMLSLIDYEKVPALESFLKGGTFIKKIYRFIMSYDSLQLRYATLPETPENAGLWARRDAQAAEWLRDIYTQYGITGGFRRYDFIPAGRNAAEVSYSCAMVARFLEHGLAIRLTNPDPDDPGAMPAHPAFEWFNAINEHDDYPNGGPLGVTRPCYPAETDPLPEDNAS